jgi:8-oxo-dGTP pyrophosphatase MutT (NUDIX family)
MVSNKHGDGMIFPKGGWETDETAEEAAARESMEEAGVRVGLSRLVTWTIPAHQSVLLDHTPTRLLGLALSGVRLVTWTMLAVMNRCSNQCKITRAKSANPSWRAI